MGCVYTDEIASYVEGYNNETLRRLRAGEIAHLVLKHKVTSREAIESRFRAEGGFELEEGGRAVDSPLGRYRIEVSPRFGKAGDTPYLFATELHAGNRRELHFVHGKARVLFDHDDTTLLVRDDGFKRYFTIDIACGKMLQGFPDADRGW